MPSSPGFDVTLVPAPREPDHLGVVLFDLPGEQFAPLVADLRRLSRQPIQFRWLPTPENDAGRVLIRTESPPLLIVSRVNDHNSATARAYTEQGTRVWVEFGYRSSRADVPPLPGNGILLIRRSGECEAIADGEFIDEVETLALPPVPIREKAGEAAPAVATRLRLARTAETEAPRLWVLRDDDALGQLTEYCRATHQQLLSRFSVAVSASAGVPCAVLRANNPKGPPPVFVGSAIAYHLPLKLPNLFVPIGTRLAPPLRRDAIRQAIGISSDRVTWLHPLGGGGFRAESLPEAAFRPLQEWVDYRVSEAVQRANPWVQSHRWDFETFVERPAVKPRLATPTPAPAAPTLEPPRPNRGILSRAFGWFKRTRRPDLELPPPALEEMDPPTIPVEEAVRSALSQGERLHLARPETLNSALERCRALETEFLRVMPTLAAEEPPAKWAELASAYDAAGNHTDAALCWLNALWGQSKPSPLWAWGWLRAEARAGRPEVKAIDPVPWLAAPPGPGTTRAMAAWVVWASLQSSPPAVLTERAAELQARLESHEHWLPVRAAWMARVATARLGRGDVLGLARTRDRLAERLLTTGLSLELDTPSFLRFAGEGVRGRFHEARRWLVDKRELIHQWLARFAEPNPRLEAGPDPGLLRHVGLEPEVANTRAYADLILAWGLTRFAEHTAADQVRRQGLAGLSDHPVHAWLRDAFEYRITQVREARPPRGPLPAALLMRLAALPDRYAVDKFREHSRILEPTTQVSAYYESIYRKAESRPASPADRVEALPADRLDPEVIQLLQAEASRDGAPYLAEVTVAALDRAFEMTEVGTRAVLAALTPALDAARDTHSALARLLEKGLAVAAHWDRPDVARELATRLLKLVDGRAGWELAVAVTGQAFRSLRRLGLKSDADWVLHHVAERVLQGQPLGRLRAARPAEWPAALRMLLHAAAGWYYAGRDDQAYAVLDEARKDLFASETPPRDRTALALAYAATLGQAPPRVALGRLEEVFQQLTGIAVGGSTNDYFSLNPILLVETAVRAVVSDDFALGPQVRAWLDADELAVRRRIRDELKQVMSGQEL